MKLYGAIASPFVRKVVVMLDLKNLEYEHIPQMPFAGDPEYLKINPLGKIPHLIDGDVSIGDSKVICRYLESAYPEPALYPKDAAQKAKADWLEELGGTRITELATGIFFQRFMRPLVFKQEPDEELIGRIIKDDLPPMQNYLESQMPSDGFIFGDFTMADLSVVTPFINAGYAQYEVDAAKWPKLAGVIARVKETPAVAKALAAEAEMFGSL